MQGMRGTSSPRGLASERNSCTIAAISRRDVLADKLIISARRRLRSAGFDGAGAGAPSAVWLMVLLPLSGCRLLGGRSGASISRIGALFTSRDHAISGARKQQFRSYGNLHAAGSHRGDPVRQRTKRTAVRRGQREMMGLTQPPSIRLPLEIANQPFIARHLGGFEPMIITRVGTPSKQERRSRDYFLRLVGDCITRWAFTDRSLFFLFYTALNIDPKSAGILYYRLSTLSSKLQLTDSTIRLVATPETLKAWNVGKKEMEALIPVRNVIAHHPMLATTDNTAGRTRHRYSIRVEPYEVEAGIRAPRAVDIKILRKHAKQVDELTYRLLANRPNLAADAKARAENLAR
jgi:hypothetical protein